MQGEEQRGRGQDEGYLSQRGSWRQVGRGELEQHLHPPTQASASSVPAPCSCPPGGDRPQSGYLCLFLSCLSFWMPLVKEKETWYRTEALWNGLTFWLAQIPGRGHLGNECLAWNRYVPFLTHTPPGAHHSTLWFPSLPQSHPLLTHLEK